MNKINFSPLLGLIQQVQLCFLFMFDFGLKYVPQWGHTFIIQEGFWYFENEVSSIINTGLLSWVCHHTGSDGREREERETPVPVLWYYRIMVTVAWNCKHILACTVWRPDVVVCDMVNYFVNFKQGSAVITTDSWLQSISLCWLKP